jgi:hypothetical protein
MDRFSSVLRHSIIFIWPIPFLLGFAVEGDSGWPEYLAYAAAGVLAVVAVGVAWMTIRQNR